MKKNKKVFFAVVLLFVILASVFLIKGFIIDRTSQEWAQEALEIQTNIFGINSMCSWTNISAGGHASLFLGERLGTRYYTVSETDLASMQATLSELEKLSERPIHFGDVRNPPAYEAFPWWQPGLEGQAHTAILDVDLNNYHYQWVIHLFDKGTNALAYSQIIRAK